MMSLTEATPIDRVEFNAWRDSTDDTHQNNLPAFTSDKQASETRLRDAYHSADCVRLELEATTAEMHEFMRQFSMRYRIADEVMNLINMNLWRGE